jgi:hypothetical protein
MGTGQDTTPESTVQHRPDETGGRGGRQLQPPKHPLVEYQGEAQWVNKAS